MVNRRTMELQARKLLVKQQKPPRPTRENKTHVTKLTREMEKLFKQKRHKAQRKQNLEENTEKETNPNKSGITALSTKNVKLDVLVKRLTPSHPISATVKQNESAKRCFQRKAKKPKKPGGQSEGSSTFLVCGMCCVSPAPPAS